jgi:2-dehydropantoate 2-reductase
LKSTSATVELSDNILKVIWTKFVFFASISGVGALTRVEVGAYRSIPETRVLLNALMREVEAVGRASGIAFDADVVNKTLTFIDNAAPAVKSAMQRDVELGRPSEMESIIGIITHKGHELNVSTPVADMIYAFLLPGERKAMARKRE